MNLKLIKKIRKYSELRFPEKDQSHNVKILKYIYEGSNKLAQAVFKKEMDEYLNAVETGSIEPGDSIAMTMFPGAHTKVVDPKP